jgi:hypothetical protein
MVKNNITENETLETKIPQTLEEQKQYYLDLFKKWEKLKSSEKLKVENPEFWQALQEVDFDNKIKNINGVHYDLLLIDQICFTLSNYDSDFEHVDYFVDFERNDFYLCDFRHNTRIELHKKINIYPNGPYINNIELSNADGSLKLILDESKTSRVALFFEDCNFDTITLENFDRGYFSPETNEYLNEMDRDGKLTLINCTWSGLPQTLTLREDFDVEEVGKKIWEKKIVIEEKFAGLKEILHQYLALFSDFVESTEGKKIQLRITTAKTYILIEIYTFNGATWSLIEQKFKEFALMSGEEEWEEAVKYVTSFGKPITDPLLSYNLASTKNMMDFMLKMQANNNAFTQGIVRSILTAKPNNLTVNIEQNHGTINLGEINQKIEKIIQNNPYNTDLKSLMEEVKVLKDKILESDMDDETKQESLEYIEQIADNIEQKDQPDKFKILKTAGRGLLSIAGKVAGEVATGYVKKQFGL